MKDLGDEKNKSRDQADMKLLASTSTPPCLSSGMHNGVQNNVETAKNSLMRLGHGGLGFGRAEYSDVARDHVR